ncbi:MmcQ/YjbR family DNA-binding protein [Carnobacterium gallinarum]|uniref:MmcQ/YjbR family DNA-binding protein n=1 Tax=Carnobacterium gallinarum TaxID=2749 RepID=UPI0005562B8D|nr:MmcQ/YjbR family DNA-binding protein [Carnobacterium gallinarum]
MAEKYLWMNQAIKDLPGAKRYYKTEWDTDVFAVANKIFGMLGQPKGEMKLLTVKGEPSKNEELREIYADIIPGYHTNKTHWISIRIESPEITQLLMEKTLQNAYHLVFNKLPKKTQQAIMEQEEEQ